MSKQSTGLNEPRLPKFYDGFLFARRNIIPFNETPMKGTQMLQEWIFLIFATLIAMYFIGPIGAVIPILLWWLVVKIKSMH